MTAIDNLVVLADSSRGEVEQDILRRNAAGSRLPALLAPLSL